MKRYTPSGCQPVARPLTQAHTQSRGASGYRSVGLCCSLALLPDTNAFMNQMARSWNGRRHTSKVVVVGGPAGHSPFDLREPTCLACKDSGAASESAPSPQQECKVPIFKILKRVGLAVSPATAGWRRWKRCADVPAARRAVPDAPDARICTDRSRACVPSACPRPDVPDAPDARICTDGQCPRPDVSDAPDAPDCGLSGVYPC